MSCSLNYPSSPNKDVWENTAKCYYLLNLDCKHTHEYLWWRWWLCHSVMSDTCDPMDCSPSGSSVHGIFQARILKWVAIFSPPGIFPTQGSNSVLLHLQEDSLLLSHWGNPISSIFSYFSLSKIGHHYNVNLERLHFINVIWLQHLK